MKSVVTLLLVISLSCGKLVIAQQAQITSNPDKDIAGDQGINSPQMFFIISNDGGISGINSVPSFQCNTTISPSVVIENFGSDLLTTATLQYFVDGGTPQYYYWEGSLPPFWMDTVVLPPMSVSAGNHTLDILVVEANGAADFNGGNNGSIQFNVVGTSDPVPYAQEFDQLSLPDGYFIENYNSGPTWNHFTIISQYGALNCMRMPFYTNDVSNDIDDLYMKNIDLSNVGQAELSFDLAYAYYSNYYWDELKVMVSGNCGNDWDVLYDKSKNDLATAPAMDVSFTPGFSQWRNEVVNISQYTGNSNVIIKFEAVSGHGNNLYLDNITINDNVGIDEVNSNKNTLKLYPNPANSFVNVSLPEMNFAGNEISVLNSLGQKIYTSKIASTQITVPVDQLASGAYVISVSSKNAQLLSAPLIVFH
jgi:Secretion system C-terminal sorting domain